MKIIHIRPLPLMRGFYAINLFGIVFSREPLSDREKRHEHIHTLQQREMLFVPFFLWYLLEWLLRLLVCRSSRRAYYAISFEREAYANESFPDYPRRRRRFAWFRYLREPM